MWWCCGKPSKDATGCKFAKHFSKEDEDDDNHNAEKAEGEDDEAAAANKSKNLKCFCCKEKGHS